MGRVAVQGFLGNLLGRGATTSLNIEYDQVALQPGTQHVNFKKPFLNTPTVTGSFTTASGTFPKVNMSPFSISILKTALTRISLSRISLSKISIPHSSIQGIPTIPTLKAPTDQLVPWGNTWQNIINQNCGSIPVLGLICGGLGDLLSIVGNAFFYAYYAANGDFGAIAKTIMNQVYADMVGQINDHVINKLNPIIDSINSQINGAISSVEGSYNAAADNMEAALNGQIQNTEAAINNKITEIESAVNLSNNNNTVAIQSAVNIIPDIVMKTLGYQPGKTGYPLPQTVNISNVTIEGFDVYVPTPGLTLHYVAISS